MFQLYRVLRMEKKKLKNPSKPQPNKKPPNPRPLSLPVAFSLPRQIADLFGLLFIIYAQIYTKMVKLPLHSIQRKLFLAYCFSHFFHVPGTTRHFWHVCFHDYQYILFRCCCLYCDLLFYILSSCADLSD